MAMNASTLASIMKANLQAALTRYDNPPDDHTLSGYDFDTYLTDLCNAISQAIVSHITTAARCQGNDSAGDTHDSVQIV